MILLRTKKGQDMRSGIVGRVDTLRISPLTVLVQVSDNFRLYLQSALYSNTYIDPQVQDSE